MGSRNAGNGDRNGDTGGGPAHPTSRLLAALRQNRLVGWILFDGQRWLVTLAILAGVFVVLVALAVARPEGMDGLVSDMNALRSLFTALVSGAILIVSIVSSISSIVLSQEISDIETEQERIETAIDFRHRVEELADVEGSPERPAAFLELVLYAIYRQTTALVSVASEGDDPEFAADVRSFADDLLSETTEAATSLEGAAFGTFTVLSTALNYDSSTHLTTGRRLARRYGDTLTDREDEVLQDLIAAITYFASAREYVLSLYYEREVARLASLLLYVSLPVIVGVSYFLLVMDDLNVPDVHVGPVSTLPLFVLFAFTVSLAPYVVLTAFVIRIAAITTRTLAAGPFVVRHADRSDVVELDVDDPETWETSVDAGDGGLRYGDRE